MRQVRYPLQALATCKKFNDLNVANTERFSRKAAILRTAAHITPNGTEEKQNEGKIV
jgi:hypothetical protein